MVAYSRRGRKLVKKKTGSLDQHRGKSWNEEEASSLSDGLDGMAPFR